MQVELSSVITAVAALLSLILGAAVTVLKFSVERELKRVDDKFTTMQAKLDAEVVARGVMTERLHQDELATEKLQGNLALQKQAHENHVLDLSDLKKDMATKAEIRHLETMLERVLDQLERRPASGGQYRYTPHAGMPAQGTQSPPPPKTR